MKRVLLLGAGSSGKSTLAKRLARKTGLPLIHLDGIYWRSGWNETPKQEWVSTIERLIQQPEWIMDGNYGGTLDLRLTASDTVIIMDTSPWSCIGRLVKRRLRHAGRSRPEMALGCPERLDAKFLWWMATYRMRRVPDILAKLRKAQHSDKSIIVLRSALEAESFIRGII